MTFYKTTDQLPDYEDYSMKGRTYRFFTDALFPFGYGLSYTAFEVGGEQAVVGADGSVKVSVDVTNTGRRDGVEIVQAYVRNPQDADGPLKTLRGFQRVAVKAGQTAKATIALTRESFECFDTETNTMRVKPGQYEVLVGTSSRVGDLKRLTVTIQ